ncbi:MAG: dTDP-glucose 4,6-dehydratase [Holosporaceae bacterium]|jgi:dTDP-glucose 4,6-dehydratase|nr:dTDP-glucose 4,6-dehydratase [Holosporaceae bacterium]
MFAKNVLITGGAGFIGSNFVPYFCEKYHDYRIINLDKLTYAGSLDNIAECEAMLNYVFVQGDICDVNLLADVFEKYGITDIIHFAAESHVDNSIVNPRAFVETNVLGTFTLLEAFRKRHGDSIRNRFHHISTDEVYGTLVGEGYFTEKAAYAPNSPYSASKAGSDMLVRSYFRTYNMNTVTSNCSNNYGPKQHQEKLIPTIIRHALAEEPIPIYGDGKNIRDWLYVMDHCEAIDLIFHHGGRSGETYNIGGRNEYTNMQIANKICKILDEKCPRRLDDGRSRSHSELITFVPDRPGHDRRYAMDASKLERELGWKAKENFDSGILKTIEWYLGKFVN